MIALWLAALVACDGDAPTEPTDDTTPTDTGASTRETAHTGVHELHDPVSMPLQPTLSVSDFQTADSCGACHADHVDEWASSMHSYAMVDPVFRALVGVRQTDLDGAEDRFCLQCHTPVGSRGGEIFPGFSFDELSPVVEEGIGCETCHKVDEVVRPNNAGFTLDPGGPMRGGIADPIDSPAHTSAYSALIDDGSALCGSCHDVIETSGLNLERPYEEFLESPSFEQGGRCGDCHMPSRRGSAVQGGPERELHDHRFIGVDVPLEPGYLSPEDEAALRDEVHRLLVGSVQLDVSAPAPAAPGDQLDLVVGVTNLIDAHNFPTGTTFIRQAWLEVVATDADGQVLYSTGTLDANGDLRNFFSAVDPFGDDDLISFSSTLINASGTPEIFSWRATEHWPHSLPPLHERVFTLFVPTRPETRGPVTIDARLRFRSHGPYLLRALGLDHLIDRLEVVDIDAVRIEVPLDAPQR